MSAGVFGVRGLTRPVREETRPREVVDPLVSGWSPEKFAQEQLRRLVWHVFSPGREAAVRQVVFSAVDPETNVQSICRRVGEILAAETAGQVAVVADHWEGPQAADSGARAAEADRRGTPRERATRLGGNLWAVPLRTNGDALGAALLGQCLGTIRREFEYSIVAGTFGESANALASAQYADGIILVLSARYTRRVAARRVRDALDAARVRLLGTVLIDREFPIPEGIYRRL